MVLTHLDTLHWEQGIKIKINNITEKAIFGELVEHGLNCMCHYKELSWQEDVNELKKYKEECMRLFEEKSESPYKHPTDDSEILVDLLKHPRVIELVEICMEADLNEDVKVDALQDWMYLKPPGSLGRDVHQDIFYTHANRGEIINTSIHLNSADKDNGGLFVWGG